MKNRIKQVKYKLYQMEYMLILPGEFFNFKPNCVMSNIVDLMARKGEDQTKSVGSCMGWSISITSCYRICLWRTIMHVVTNNMHYGPCIMVLHRQVKICLWRTIMHVVCLWRTIMHVVTNNMHYGPSQTDLDLLDCFGRKKKPVL